MFATHQDVLTGDVAMKLRTVQQLRKLLECAEDFPVTGTGIKHQQVGSSCFMRATLLQQPASISAYQSSVDPGPEQLTPGNF
jgi:hypothetical protein